MSEPDQRKPKRRTRQSIERPTRRVRKPHDSLVAFFGRSPLAEAIAAGEIDLERHRDPIRDIAL